jgi:hypothetical protein
LLDATENKRIYEIEIEELKNHVRKLTLEMEQKRAEKPLPQTKRIITNSFARHNKACWIIIPK